MKKHLLFLVFLVFVGIVLTPCLAYSYTGEVITKQDDLYPNSPFQMQFRTYDGNTSEHLMIDFQELRITGFERTDIEGNQGGTFNCTYVASPYPEYWNGTYSITDSVFVLYVTSGPPNPTYWSSTDYICTLHFNPTIDDITFKRGVRYSYGGPGRVSIEGSSGYPIYGIYNWYFLENATYDVSWRAINTLDSSSLGGVTWSVYDVDDATWYNDTLDEDEYEYSTPIPPGHCVYGIATKSGFNSDRVPSTLCDVISGDDIKYAYLSPVGGGGYVTVTFYVYWMNGAINTPVYGALVSLGAVTHATSMSGYTTFNVSNQTNYTYGVTKTGFQNAGGIIVVLDDDISKSVQLFPLGTMPPTPTAVPTTVPSTAGYNIFQKIGAIFAGANILIALCIILACAYFVGGGTAGVSQMSGQGAAIGGVIGFVISCVANLLPMWALYAAVALAMLVIAFKWWGGGSA